MSANTLDPVIHAAVRLRIVATLAALPDTDALSFGRLQDILDLTPGNLITHLRKLEDAGYVDADKTGTGTQHEPRSRSRTKAASHWTATPPPYET
jgi:DNA-binding transcriptional ArsR family regulator